jgi:hypothetical protein
MSQGPFQNTGVPLPGPAPGRLIETVERYCLPSGKVRELRKIIGTIQDPSGIFRTQELVEVVPALDCSCVPHDLHDIAECTRCGSVMCASKHSGTCPSCGQVYCTACLCEAEVEDSEGVKETIRVCRDCADEMARPVILKVLRKIWG